MFAWNTSCRLVVRRIASQNKVIQNFPFNAENKSFSFCLAMCSFYKTGILLFACEHNTAQSAADIANSCIMYERLKEA